MNMPNLVRQWMPAREPGDDVLAEASTIALQRVDEAAAVRRPDEVGEFYIEVEYGQRASAQPRLFKAEGERHARPHAARAEALRERAADQSIVVELQKQVVTDSSQRLMQMRRVLTPYVRRAPKDKAFYMVRMLLILLGDIAGITGAAIMLGEFPALAVLQAVSVGAAGVTSGLLGSEIKDARLARKRARDELSAAEQAFAHLFRGPDPGEAIAKTMVLGGLGIIALVFGGVAALRSTTEGVAAGAVFGCMAAAVALASWVNCYAYADEVADLLDGARVQFKADAHYLDNLSRGRARSTHVSETVTAQSIRDEYEQRGLAAHDQLQAAKNRVLHTNPGVAGHGRPAPLATLRSPGRTSSVKPVSEDEADVLVLDGVRSNGHRSGAVT